MSESGPSHEDSTCWTLIRHAAGGDCASREAFARRYAPAIRAYLAARWRGSRNLNHLDDAVQDVFVECWRADGALDRVEPGRSGGFRAFLYGVTRNVALRSEARRARSHARESPDDGMQGQDRTGEPLSRVFDRAWAQSVMREAAALQAAQAARRGDDAIRRVELLRLRFQENLPIRDIATRWHEDPTRLHREYARARKEFREAILSLMRFYAGGDLDPDRECEELLGILSEPR